jgi:hypothetical protein
MRYVQWIVVLVVGLVVQSALAADPDPATPQGAQKVVRAAADKGDKAEVRKFLHSSNPTEEKLADAIAENAVVGAAAYKAAVAKFGEEETRKTLMGVVPLHPPESEEAKTEWKIEGDRATVVSTGKTEFAGPPLTKIDGIWKMAMKEVIADRPKAEVQQMTQLMEKQSNLMTEYTKEVQDGKYKTAAELRQVALERMQVMIKQMQAAATQPAK